MAEDFSPDEWEKIRALLAADQARYGLPQRRDGSVVLASFNIRKCGNPAKRSPGALELMTDFIRRCDLVAVQEVMSDLSMIEELRRRGWRRLGAAGLRRHRRRHRRPGDGGSLDRRPYEFEFHRPDQS